MKAKQPVFPEVFPRLPAVWGMGNHLIGPRLIASIPTYTFHPEGSAERDNLYNLYWDNIEREYQVAKQIFESNIFVGTVWKGNTLSTVKITKIYIDSEKAYICYSASEQEKNRIKELNKDSVFQYRVPKNGKYPLSSFLSAIKNEVVTILSTPIIKQSIFQNLNQVNTSQE